MKNEVSIMRKSHQPLSPLSPQSARLAAGIATAVLLAYVSLAGTASAKPFEDYIKPMPIVSPLSSASWGEAALPRDLSNGIESAMGAGVHPQYYYWDGEIIKAKDGKYHMFMSTFDANTNFGTGWMNSDAYHAISDTNVLGPYKRQDYVYSSHKGHNVSAAELPDGTYAVIVSEIVPFQIFKSSSLDGPWTGCSPQSDVGASNISMFPRHDGKYQIVERHGTIAISDTLCGHYVKQRPTCSYTQTSDAADSVYPKRTSIPGVSNPQFTWQEDPHIWRSGGTYHIIYSGSGDRVGWHVYSPDGLSWKDNGYAWSPRDYQKIFCYEGSTTCNAWYKMERPGVVLQDGHPTHITWAVSDVDKDNQVTPGTNHGTKVVVVPFDGVAFDNDFGTGGSSGTGGAGGSSGTGGAGGATGRDGGMGGSGSGGATGTGGRSGSDGGLGGNSSGGATGGLGGNSSGGATGAGGMGSGSGGATGTGGRSGGTGGTTAVASGGASGSGGAGTGGMTAGSGGVTGAGGAGSGGNGTGGSGAGGQAGGNSGSGGASTKPGGGSASGCACTIRGREHATGSASLLLLGFGLLSLVRRRRSAKTP
jgi:hypothetical protein